MGLFDSVYAKCPKCGRPVEWQSKAGECCLRRYNSDRVPSVIAADLMREEEQCGGCGAVLRIVPERPPQPEFVALDVQLVTPNIELSGACTAPTERMDADWRPTE